MKKIMILMIFAVMIFSANSCSKAKKEWKNTIAKNSIRDYVEYRKKYPNSTYADSVKHRIWKKTLSIGSIQAFEYFIDKYRVGAYVDSAKNRAKDLMVTRGEFISAEFTATADLTGGSVKITEMYWGGTLNLKGADGKEIKAICPISLAKNVKTGQILEVEYDKRLKKYKVIKIIEDSK